MRLKKTLKTIFLAFAALIVAILVIFLVLVQRDLSRAHTIVEDRIKGTKSRGTSAPQNLIAAFDIAFPEESPHSTYLGYLYAHDFSYQNEQLNLMTTRMIAYPLRTDFAKLLELDYQVHNLSRIDKINFVFDEAGRKVFGGFQEFAEKNFKKNPAEISVCQSLILIYKVLDQDVDQAKLAFCKDAYKENP